MPRIRTVPATIAAAAGLEGGGDVGGSIGIEAVEDVIAEEGVRAALGGQVEARLNLLNAVLDAALAGEVGTAP